MIYGYARISSAAQNEDSQIITLTEKGGEAKNIFVDKQSGKDFKRSKYQRLVSKTNGA